MRSPRPPEVDLGCSGFRRDAAVVEHVAARLTLVAFALRRDHYLGVRQRVKFATVEEGQRVAEDKVDVALDIAVREVLARRAAGSLLGFTALSVGIKSVLV